MAFHPDVLHRVLGGASTALATAAGGLSYGALGSFIGGVSAFLLMLGGIFGYSSKRVKDAYKAGVDSVKDDLDEARKDARFYQRLYFEQIGRPMPPQETDE